MLDIETKRRIDTARDILVGKIPDPKSQIEQITIALIYKFMDDMDKKSEELGGKSKFFTKDYAKYAWNKILDQSVSGFELVALYGEAIQSMNQNPNLPQLFRDIFKNAYLPYRDPETLRAFLRIIDDFKYDHSERLGDAFEYLLSVMGSQGDAGQFRTPRHIIDFIVKVVDPSKKDTILDPACGTAGFLICAYKHIVEKNMKDGKLDLTPDEKKKLAENIVGYDISPDMVRLSLVNLYLHGFKNPHIFEYDTLTSDEKWDEHFDVCLANPPFMTPKGGIRPHKRFSVDSNRAEVLFVDYMADHLTNDGKAGIVVPEGIIFQSGTTYKQLRKMLVDNALYAVASLPAGVFNPYSGVKTSILFLDKRIAKKTKDVLFVKIETDGYNLGAQRREIKENDIPLALEILRDYQKAVLDGAEPKLEKYERIIAHIVSKEKIGKSGDYNLSGDRYKENKIYAHKDFEMVELGEVCEFETGSRDKGGALTQGIPSIGGEQISEEGFIKHSKMKFVSEEHFNEMKKGLLQDNDVLMVKDGATTGKIGLYKKVYEKAAINEHVYILRAKNSIKPSYLYYLLKTPVFQEKLKRYIKGIIGGVSSEIKEIKIPLPSLEVQERIVEEIENYQNIIDGAKKVVDSYKPSFRIDKDWDIIELGNVCKTSSGGTPLKSKNEYFENGTIPWINSGEVSQGFIYAAEKFITEDGLKNSSAKIFPKNTVLVAMYGATVGKVGILKIDASTNQAICGIYPDEKHIPEFLFYYLLGLTDMLIKMSTGGAQPNISQQIIRNLKIPLPPLDIQKQIISKIEEEQTLVDSNKKLIELFEKKIAERIAEVWGE
ncbi:MAG: N-6 DNA methylase [archaeon]